MYSEESIKKIFTCYTAFKKEIKRIGRILFLSIFYLATSSLYAEIIVYPPDTIPNDPFSGNPTAVGPSAASPSNNTVTVTLSGSEITQSVYGGYSNTAGVAVTGNTVMISDPTGLGTIGRDVSGARTSGSGSTGIVSNNSVTINGGTIGQNVYGAFGGAGAASNNSVTINGADVNAVFGARTGSGSITNSTVTINGSTVSGSVRGGLAQSGVTVSSVTNCTVVITDSTVNGLVYGGNSTGSNSSANSNSVTINGGSVGSDIYGGFASVSSINNTVTIKGLSTLSGRIFGGNRPVFTGNTLNWQASNLMTVAGVLNFETYNFFLPQSLTNGQTLISVSGTTATNLSGTTVTITGIEGGGSSLQSGDVLTLIDKTTNAPTTFNGTDVTKGFFETYNFELVNNPTQLQIRVVGGAKLNPQVQAFSEGWIGGLALGNQGADLVENQGMDQALLAAEGVTGPFVFGAASGSSSRYQTGSHVDVKSFSMLTGLGVRGEFSCESSFLLGGFFETGTGNYNSFNSFSTSAAIDGDGNTSYVGGGVLAYYNPFDCFYVEMAGRAGQTKTGFGSSDFTRLEGINIGYRGNAAYYGAHVGLGTFFCCADAISVDLSSKFLWTCQEGSSFEIVGNPLVFKNSDSLRWRNKGRLFYDLYAYLTPFVGAAYEYEFDGKVKGTLNGTAVTPPSLRGGTGVGEIGLVCEPFGDYSLFVEVGIQGYVGKRQGVSGNLQVKYFF